MILSVSTYAEKELAKTKAARQAAVAAEAEAFRLAADPLEEPQPAAAEGAETAQS